MEYRALLMGYRVLLIGDKALLMEYRALAMGYRALLMEYTTLLQGSRALLTAVQRHKIKAIFPPIPLST